MLSFSILYVFFFNDTATTEIYTLSLHDALPISIPASAGSRGFRQSIVDPAPARRRRDRKSTRLNSSHTDISYAVFCLKNKNDNTGQHPTGISLSSMASVTRDLYAR